MIAPSPILPRTIDVPLELRGRRVLLRPYRNSDAASMHAAIDESRADLLEFGTWVDQHARLEQTLDYCARSQARFIERESMPVAIVDAVNGRYLGGSGLHRNDWEARKFELGYWLRTSERGKGYVVETVCVLTRSAFEDLGANRVELRCDSRNKRSRRVAELAGFPLEATLRREKLAADGSLRDTLVHAVLREDYDRLLPSWAAHFA